VLREGQGSILDRWSFSLWQRLISVLVDNSQIGPRVPPFPEILLGLGRPGATTLGLFAKLAQVAIRMRATARAIFLWLNIVASPALALQNDVQIAHVL
jgi:hypothetical protein